MCPYGYCCSRKPIVLTGVMMFMMIIWLFVNQFANESDGISIAWGTGESIVRIERTRIRGQQEYSIHVSFFTIKTSDTNE